VISRISWYFASLAFLAGSIVAEPAYAQAPAEAEGTVTRIVVQGNRRIEEATILASIGLRRGDELTQSRVRRDLKAIYATGFFDDVRIEASAEEGGVALVIIVDEKPAVRDVRIAGNKKIDEDDINEVIDIRSFAVLSQADVNENVERIRDLYVEKGYYLAEITPRVEAVGDDQVDLTFDIQENRKVVVQRVEITGNEKLSDAKVKRFLQTREGGALPWLTNRGTFRRENLDADQVIIRQVYNEEGYVDAQVSPPDVYLSPDKRFIYVSFAVEEGPQYTIGKIDAEGEFIDEQGLTKEAVMQITAGRTVYDIQDEQWRKATGKNPLRLFAGTQQGPKVETGEVFKLSEVYAVMSAIQDFYSDQGYAFVNVQPMPQTDPEKKVVDLTYLIETGEQVRIGNINITGNDPTFDKVVRREIQINEGDLYRGSLIKASRARLERLGYFEKVDISTPRGAGPNVLDMNVQVSEQPTGSFSLGLGFSSLEQFVFTANVSKNNFLGLGYVMSAAVNWSSLRRQGNVSFFDPYFLDTRWTFNFSAYSITREFQLNEYQRGGSLGFGRYLDPRDDIQLELEYTVEDVGLTSITAYQQRMLGGQLFENGLTSSLGMSLSVDKRNNRIFATKGVYANAKVELAGGFRLPGGDQLLSVLGGEFNFVESNFNVRFFQPVIPNSDALVFRFNSTAGFIWSTDGRVIPWVHRYRAGGINSVRGYNWFSLGPSLRVPNTEDPIHADDDIIVGGTQTWINNVELEAPLVRQAGILGVVFFDAGNAFGDPWGQGGIDPRDLRFSFGAGVRWRSPIGPLRFEYGFPIQPEEGERTSVFDFSIGSFF
jgi:outer membrane protein insertion porin family